MIRFAAPFTLALALTGGAAWAQSEDTAADPANMEDQAEAGMEGMDHGDMASDGAATEDPSSAMLGYQAAMQTSMEVMPDLSDSTGDADADFLLMMIPHHQSAVDMARIVIEVGDDPEVKALAEAVVALQEAEILAMQEMLAAMDVQPEPAAEE